LFHLILLFLCNVTFVVNKQTYIHNREKTAVNIHDSIWTLLSELQCYCIVKRQSVSEYLA